jgi:hypothetical protein
MTLRFAERGDSGAGPLSGAALALNVGGPIVSTVVSHEKLAKRGWQTEVGKSGDPWRASPRKPWNQGLERLWFNIVARIDTGRFGVTIKFA